MQFRDLTAVGRSLDPRHPTNVAIAVLSLLVTIAAAAWRWLAGDRLLDGVLWGVAAGLAVFFAWALAREMDPDHDLSAFVGAGLALAALPFLGLPQLLPLFWLMLAVRIVNRSVGLPARPLDVLGLIALGLWLTLQGGWIYGLVTVAALFLDGRLQPPLRRDLLLAAPALAAVVVLALFGQAAPRGGWDSDLLRVLQVLAAIMFAVAIHTLGDVRALCDATGEPMRPHRLRAAQVLALVTALLVTAHAGEQGLVALLPLWAAMLGTALYDLGTHLSRALWPGSRQAGPT